MQTAITINQKVARESGLSLQDAAVFAHVWSKQPIEPGTFLWKDHRVWFPVTPDDIVEALPLLDYAPKTVQASIRKLLEAGLLERLREDGKTYYSVTSKGRGW